MSTGGLEPECRGDWLTPDPHAPEPAEILAITHAARNAIHYTAVETTAATTGRLVPLRQRMGAASVATSIQKVRSLAGAGAPAGRQVLPAIVQVQTAGCR